MTKRHLLLTLLCAVLLAELAAWLYIRQWEPKKNWYAAFASSTNLVARSATEITNIATRAKSGDFLFIAHGTYHFGSNEQIVLPEYAGYHCSRQTRLVWGDTNMECNWAIQTGGSMTWVSTFVRNNWHD